jgi:hypothetical protein
MDFVVKIFPVKSGAFWFHLLAYLRQAGLQACGGAKAELEPWMLKVVCSVIQW